MLCWSCDVFTVGCFSESDPLYSVLISRPNRTSVAIIFAFFINNVFNDTPWDIFF